MPQDPTFMDCKKVEYPPDKSVKWLESYQVDIDLELDPIFELFFKGVTTNFKPHLSLQREKLIERLVQVEFTFDDKTILFPNFENIFSRPESVKKSWFLPPEFEGEDIYQSKQDIDTWWVDFQKIYDSSIRKKIEAKTIQLLFLKLSKTNVLIEYLFQTLINLPDTRFPIEDEKDLMYSNHCCYLFFRDNYIEKDWQLWLLAKATVRYYHTIFAPALHEKTNSREIRRLSNRFPEYANAVRWLAKFNEYLHSNYDKKNVKRFFHAQSIERQTETRISKRSIGQLASLNFYQCRVCGAMCIPTPVLKLLEKGAGKGKSKKICSAPECEKAWELLRKSLPPNPNDEKGGLILLSHL